MTKPRTALREIVEDPSLRRMLASHIHCGEAMRATVINPGLPGDVLDEEYEGGLLTYTCACGFSFDQPSEL